MEKLIKTGDSESVIRAVLSKSTFSIRAEMPPSRMPSGHQTQSYVTMDDHGGSRAVKDTKEIGSAYDRYLQNVGNLYYCVV